MKVIKYNVELLEPTLVTSVQGDPNSAVAFDYLPGSVLRGILIGKYLNNKYVDRKKVDAANDDLQRLFFNGTTRYLNAYPLDAYGDPGLPVPISWQQAKDDKDGPIFDFAVKEGDDKKQWQPVRESFYTPSSEGVILIEPKRTIAVHTQRTPRFGRAMPEYRPLNKGQAGRELVRLLTDDDIPGAVYRYDALAARQTFQAAILCDNDADAAILQDFIRGHILLGGSRSGGYGLAEISLSSDETDQDTDEHGQYGSNGRLIVTLQSDVLLRDEHGQFAVDPKLLGRVLSRYLSKSPGEVQLELEDAFLDTQVIAGFNRKWGLPLPQALAMRMGSVLVFKCPRADSSRLRDLEVRGIGERRAEGFGRIVFNRQRAEKLMVEANERLESSDSNNITFSEETRALARLMVKRMLKKRLEERILAAASAVKIANPPFNAQLSRLRSVIMEELRKTTPDIKKIHQFIKDIQERGSARRQFEHSTVNDIPLLRWLEYWLRCDDKGTLTVPYNEWKDLLGLKESETDIKIGDETAQNDRGEIGEELRREYVLRFIDLVLANAAKQRGKEN